MGQLTELREVTLVAVDPAMVRKGVLRAAEVVEAGWCRRAICQEAEPAGVLEDGGSHKAVRDGVIGVDSFCVAGALLKASGELVGYDTGEHKALCDAMRACVIGHVAAQVPGTWTPWSTISDYNDSVCRSGTEAAAMLREAAASVRD